MGLGPACINRVSIATRHDINTEMPSGSWYKFSIVMKYTHRTYMILEYGSSHLEYTIRDVYPSDPQSVYLDEKYIKGRPHIE